MTYVVVNKDSYCHVRGFLMASLYRHRIGKEGVEPTMKSGSNANLSRFLKFFLVPGGGVLKAVEGSVVDFM